MKLRQIASSLELAPVDGPTNAKEAEEDEEEEEEEEEEIEGGGSLISMMAFYSYRQWHSNLG